MKKVVVIVAGGSGSRMVSDTPKQFLLLGDLPVLMHTIRAFYNYNYSLRIILVLPLIQIETWNQLCNEYKFSVEHEVVGGGETRFNSVKNGLVLINEPSLIAVHDGVRPFVSIDTIDRCFQMAEKMGNAIPVIDPVESIRMMEGEDSLSIDRTKVKLVQTPQVFQSSILLDAYNVDYNPIFTDDASVIERMGHRIYLVDGNRENIKITSPIDLKLGELFLKG